MKSELYPDYDSDARSSDAETLLMQPDWNQVGDPDSLEAALAADGPVAGPDNQVGDPDCPAADGPGGPADEGPDVGGPSADASPAAAVADSPGPADPPDSDGPGDPRPASDAPGNVQLPMEPDTQAPRRAVNLVGPRFDFIRRYKEAEQNRQESLSARDLHRRATEAWTASSERAELIRGANYSQSELKRRRL